jgi:hypothetical protein
MARQYQQRCQELRDRGAPPPGFLFIRPPVMFPCFLLFRFCWGANLGVLLTCPSQVPHEYMDKNQTWGETIGLGTCMEVDNLMSRGYYPPSCPPITVTVTAPAGTPTGWQKPWHITEDPTCVFGPSASIVKSVTGELTSTTTIQYAWPDEK